MKFDFDQEKYPRKNVDKFVSDINLEYSCEPLTSMDVYINNLKSQWPKDGTYDYFKVEGSGCDGELSSVYINFYKSIPETDEQYAGRVYRKIEKENKWKEEIERHQIRRELEMKNYVNEHKEEVKKWLEE